MYCAWEWTDSLDSSHFLEVTVPAVSTNAVSCPTRICNDNTQRTSPVIEAYWTLFSLRKTKSSEHPGKKQKLNQIQPNITTKGQIW